MDINLTYVKTNDPKDPNVDNPKHWADSDTPIQYLTLF